MPSWCFCEIASLSPATAKVVDLSLYLRALRKTSYFLRALSEIVPNSFIGAPISYFALDVEERELKHTLSELHMSDLGPILSGKVETRGLLGTYESGLRFITHGGLLVDGRVNGSPEGRSKGNTRKQNASEGSSDSTPTNSSTGATSMSISEQLTLHLIFLGSSIGNFPAGKDAEFLRQFPLRPGDTFLLGLSHDTKCEDIELSYNDPKGHNREFIMNALRSAGNALGNSDLFNLNNWEYVNWYNEDERSCLTGYKLASVNDAIQGFTGHTTSAYTLTKSNFQAPTGRLSFLKVNWSILESPGRRADQRYLL